MIASAADSHTGANNADLVGTQAGSESLSLSGRLPFAGNSGVCSLRHNRPQALSVEEGGLGF